LFGTTLLVPASRMAPSGCAANALPPAIATVAVATAVARPSSASRLLVESPIPDSSLDRSHFAGRSWRTRVGEGDPIRKEYWEKILILIDAKSCQIGNDRNRTCGTKT